jgi:HPt (histidine-containing phosphotransfer) domain-containing protein
LVHVLEEMTMSPQAPQEPRKAARTARPKATEAKTGVSKMGAQKTGAADANAVPILRDGALQELAQVLGPDRLPPLIDRLLREGDAALPASRAALEQGDDAKAKAVLHSLAGAAATFGASALHGCLAQMETQIKLANPAAALAMHPDLVRIWAQTKAALAAP